MQQPIILKLLLVLTSLMTSHATTCPWEEEDLMLWSDANTWGEEGVPTERVTVTIQSGMSVVLDVSPPALRSVEIEAGGRLVWGNVEGLVLKTNHILVDGQFIIGKDTPDCRMEKKARIILTGRRDGVVGIPVVVVGRTFLTRKVIFIRSGGTLEMHGAEKKSWTKLTATIPSVNTLCATVFDIQNSVYQENKAGLHVIVWNPDGSVFDFNVFDTTSLFTDFASFISDIPVGKVVGVAVSQTIGDTADNTLDWESVYVAMETLGAHQIRSVTSTDSYAFVAIKGQTETAQEALESSEPEGVITVQGPLVSIVDVTNTQPRRLEGRYVNYTDWTNKLQFSVRSIVDDREGQSGEADFKVFNTDVIYPVITVSDDVSSWNVGDEIVVTSTDFDWRQAEVKKVIDCPACQPYQVRLDGPFEYSHYGEITFGVDERAEVGLLTRSILVEGEVEDTCYFTDARSADLCEKFGQDTHGGHILGFPGTVAYHVQQVELYHLGQQGRLGTYPLHLHLMNGTGQWLRNNTIHHSFQRCITLHAADNTEVTDNVCYDHLGHGIILEDSVERNIVIRRNLVIGTRHGTTLLSDRRSDWCDPLPPEFCNGLASFWITHPQNTLEDNVAAGSDNSGFRFTFADEPLSLSKPIQAARPDGVRPFDTRFTPIKRFYNNVAHSNQEHGVAVGGRVSTGEIFNGVFAPENAFLSESNNFLDPREPNKKNGIPTMSVLERTTAYKNKESNMDVRGGNIFTVQSTLADSPRGFVAASSGGNTSVEVSDCLFVGETANKGQPFLYTNRSAVYGEGPYPTHHFDRSIANNNPETSLTAVSFAEGPVRMTNCYFDRYNDWYWNDDFEEIWGYRPLRRAGALSFRRRNLEPSLPSNGVEQMKFGYCDNVDNGNWVLNREQDLFEWTASADGNLQNQFRDYDGSVTGRAGTQLVRDLPFFTDDNCVYYDNWGMSACPYDYAKILLTGNTGVLQGAAGSQTSPVTMRRDDVPESPLTLTGDSDIEFLTMKNRSYTVNFNGDIPRDIKVTGINLESGDVIRLGICLSNDTTQIKIRSDYVPISSDDDINYVTSMAELDEDSVGNAVYYDTTVNMVFFKLLSREIRQSIQERCPGFQCVDFMIERLDGGDGPRDCSSFTFPAFGVDEPVPMAPQPAPCTGPASSEGIGTPLEDVASPEVIEPPCADTMTVRLGPPQQSDSADLPGQMP